MDGFAVARWAAYVAAILVIGAAGFGRLLARSDALPVDTLAAARRRAGGVVLASAVVLLLAAWARLNAQARTFLEPEDPVTPDMLRLVLDTTWGAGWKAQVALAVLVAGLMLVSRRAAVHPLFLPMALALAVVTPLTGHAAGGELGVAVALPVHSLHLLGLGLWLGTLGHLAMALLPAAGRLPPVDQAAVAGPAIRNFAPLGLVGAATAVASGGFLGWNYTGPLSELWQDEYGRTLVVKLAVFALILVAAVLNWRVLGPRVDAGRLGPLRAALWLELLFGLVVVGITAVLVSLAAPGV